MAVQSVSRLNTPTLGIAFVVGGMACVSVQDMMIKQLSGGYPLHQIVFARSAIGIVFTFALIRWEGGLAILKTDQPWLHVLRGLLVVIANMAFFTALAVMPLAQATALFFVAPLFITLLSIPMLGESVGPRRILAVLVGFGGVLLMLRPGVGEPQTATPVLVSLLPVCAAFAYALMQMLTRRLGITAAASAMAAYVQAMFIIVSLGFWFVAGDGHFAEGVDNASLTFLLRAWRLPVGNDAWLFAACGLTAAVIGYCLAQAYRIADAATVAPFEYVALPLAILWGWLVWNELPDVWTTCGILLILAAGLYVFVRERKRGSPATVKRPLRKW